MIHNETNIYYAHCMNIYHTPQERRDVQFLQYFGNVVNPNGYPGVDVGYGQKGMQFFLDIIKEHCHVLAFRALPDGSIPAGIAKEIEFAYEQQLHVFEIPSNLSRRVLTVEQTREYLKECGYR